MLVFVDESGDTGRKIALGSSRYFVVSLVLFKDHQEALACDQQIDILRRELSYPEKFEFHFQHNSHKVRQCFLKTLHPYKFFFFSVVIDKEPKKLWGEGFDTKESFYKYACQMVFANARPHLEKAIVVVDKSGSPAFRKNLARYLKTKANTHKVIIKKLKQQKSHTNNLLQLADYVSGVINRKYQDKKGWQKYYRFLSSKEVWVQKWPK